MKEKKKGDDDHMKAWRWETLNKARGVRKSAIEKKKGSVKMSMINQ